MKQTILVCDRHAGESRPASEHVVVKTMQHGVVVTDLCDECVTVLVQPWFGNGNGNGRRPKRVVERILAKRSSTVSERPKTAAGRSAAYQARLDAIEAFVCEHGPVRPIAICDATKILPMSIAPLLAKLVADGRIHAVSRGLYGAKDTKHPIESAKGRERLRWWPSDAGKQATSWGVGEKVYKNAIKLLDAIQAMHAKGTTGWVASRALTKLFTTRTAWDRARELLIVHGFIEQRGEKATASYRLTAAGKAAT